MSKCKSILRICFIIQNKICQVQEGTGKSQFTFLFNISKVILKTGLEIHEAGKQQVWQLQEKCKETDDEIYEIP